MAKKRKLNSKNPIYQDQTPEEGKTIEKRIKMCDAPIRTASGHKTGETVAVYGIWYK